MARRVDALPGDYPEDDPFWGDNEEPEAETVSGKVESINRANTGVKIDGEWYNYTKPEWRGEPWHPHKVGDYVMLTLEKWNDVLFVKTVQRGKRAPEQDSGPTPSLREQAANAEPPELEGEPVREQAMNHEPYRDPTRTSIERQTALKVAGEIVVAGLAHGVIQSMQEAGNWLAELAKLGADVTRDVQETEA